MPTTLTLDDHLAALETSGHRLVSLARDAGLDAPVPTCPAWDVRALLAHQTMVHRWAAAQVTGGDPDQVPNQTAIREMEVDLTAYYEDGLGGILAALRAAPDDLQAMTFLNDAPPPRRFWARRQAHETTIHMVDALAATLGRTPTAAESGIDRLLAADGLDELLRGFFTRGRSKLFDGTEYTIAIVPDDVDRRWVVHVGPQLTVAAGDPPVPEGAGAVLSGTAGELYLALWNRGDTIGVEGRDDILSAWHANQRVRWS